MYMFVKKKKKKNTKKGRGRGIVKLVLYSLVRSENVHALMNVTEEGEGGGEL